MPDTPLRSLSDIALATATSGQLLVAASTPGGVPLATNTLTNATTVSPTGTTSADIPLIASVPSGGVASGIQVVQNAAYPAPGRFIEFVGHGATKDGAAFGAFAWLDGQSNYWTAGSITISGTTSGTGPITIASPTNLPAGGMFGIWADVYGPCETLRLPPVDPPIRGYYSLYVGNAGTGELLIDSTTTGARLGFGLVPLINGDTEWQTPYPGDASKFLPDVNLWRAAAGQLQTDANFIAGPTLSIGTQALGVHPLDVHITTIGGVNDNYAASFYQDSSTTSQYCVLAIAGAMTACVGYFGVGGATTGNAAFHDAMAVGTQTAHSLSLITNDAARLTIDATGAATFSASVTATGAFSAARSALGGATDLGATVKLIVNIQNGYAGWSMRNTSAAVDNSRWDISASGSTLQFRTADDAYSSVNNWLTVSRSGLIPTAVALPTESLTVNGASAGSSAAQLEVTAATLSTVGQAIYLQSGQTADALRVVGAGPTTLASIGAAGNVSTSRIAIGIADFGSATVKSLIGTVDGNAAWSLYNASSTSGERRWDISPTGSTLQFRTADDSYSSVDYWLTVTRSGLTPTAIAFPKGTVSFGGAIGVNGASPPAKAASPGTASGTDAAVINAISTILRNAGFCA